MGWKPDLSDIMMKNNQLVSDLFIPKICTQSDFFLVVEEIENKIHSQTLSVKQRAENLPNFHYRGTSCKTFRKKSSTGHIRPPSRRSRRRNHSLSLPHTKWSSVNAESSVLSV